MLYCQKFVNKDRSSGPELFLITSILPLFFEESENRMIIFRRIEDKLYLAKDKYTPSYIIEMCKIGPSVIKLIEKERFDALFIIMMIHCPNEVRVELELSENAFRELQQRRPEIVSKIKKMLDHKWIESEKAHRDIGGAALVDWILKYDTA